MLIGNKWFYIILGTLFSILIVMNLVYWTTNPDLGMQLIGGGDDQVQANAHPQGFMGFKQLFDNLSTYPGPAITIDVLNKWCNVFTNFNVTNISVIDWFIALFRLITGPIVAGVSIVGDIIVNVIWLFNFIFIKGFGDLFRTRESIYYMPIH